MRCGPPVLLRNVNPDKHHWVELKLVGGTNPATDAGRAEIHWPSGAVEKIKLPGVYRIFTITKAQGITSELCSGKPCVAVTGKLIMKTAVRK